MELKPLYINGLIKWVTWVRTLLIGVISLLVTGSGPPCWSFVLFFLLRGNLVHRVEIDMELKMKDLNS